MNLRTLSFRGLTRFRRKVVIDFDAMPQGLVAIAGPNGAGKTTILEAIIVAIYGEFPTRPGSVYEYLNPPMDGEVPRPKGESGRTRKPADAVVDLTVDLDGRRWRFRRRFDATARTQGCQVWIDGEAHGEGKTGEAAELVAAHWPPLSQVLASVFAAQGGEGSFLSLKPADRKALIVRMLGLEHLQDLAKLASEDAATCSSARDRAREAVERAEQADGRLAEARAMLAETRQRQQACAQADADAQDTLRELTAELTAARAEWEAAHAAVTEQEKRVADLAAAEQQAADVWSAARRALADVEHAAAEVPALRAAAADLDTLRAAFDHAEAEHRRTTAAAEQAERDVQAAAQARDRAQDTIDKIDGVLAAAGAVDLDAARRHAEAERAAVAAVAAAAAEVAALRPKLASLRAAAAQEEQTRKAIKAAETRSGLLADVPCGGQKIRLDADLGLAVDCSACPLLVDAVRAKDSLPELRDDLEFVAGAGGDLARAEEEQAEAQARRGVAEVQATAYRGAEAELVAAEREAARLDEIRASRAFTVSKLTDCTAKLTEAEQALTAARVVVVPPCDRSALTAAEQAHRRLADVAALAGAADARREAAERAAVAANAAAAALLAARQRMPDLQAEESRCKVALNERRQPQAEAAEAAALASRELASTASANARAAGAVEALEDAEGKLDDARALLVVADQEAEDAALLAFALGRDGVQAMELDAVGPAVSSIATEILQVVYGPRFVVQMITQVAKAGVAGRRGETKEVFDVRVIDDVRGTDGPASRLSGGEQVVVSEALKLALAIFAAQSGASKLRTLVRDESDGALDDERAAHYPAMLRRAQELGGFTRVLLVSHRPDNVAACDAVLRVQGGGAVLEI